MNKNAPSIVLASTSKYRKALLESVGLSPICIPPDCDEDSIKASAHSPLEVAEKRAQLKAASLPEEHKAHYQSSLVIGSDQLGELDGEILGKPGNIENATEQLKRMSGKTHQLITSMCIVFNNQEQLFTNITKLKMHSLTDTQIEKYVELDNPIDCAGAYKFECHGRWLFESVESDDWSAITGLPMKELMRFMHSQDLSILGNAVALREELKSRDCLDLRVEL